MANTVFGDCRLCKNKNVALLDSHVLPRWAYRRAITHDQSGEKRDPVWLKSGKAFLSSSEVKEHLLCEACEQGLGKDEDYVARLAYRDDGRLGLLDLTSAERLGGAGLYVMPAGVLDCQAIVRFAASVFWRAHESSRPECANLRLWNAQAEGLRLFVLGEAELPWRVCFTACVLMDSSTGLSGGRSTCLFPETAKKGADGIHEFLVCGLLFRLYTGEHAADIQGACLHCGKGRGILVSHPSQIKTIRKAVSNIRAATPKGKLGRIR